MEERKLYRKRAEQIKAQIAAVSQRPQDEATQERDRPAASRARQGA